MSNRFNRHLRSVGESYGEHIGQAWSFAWPMLVAGLAGLVHGLLPFAFERTASTCIKQLYARVAERDLAVRVATAAPDLITEQAG